MSGFCSPALLVLGALAVLVRSSSLTWLANDFGEAGRSNLSVSNLLISAARYLQLTVQNGTDLIRATSHYKAMNQTQERWKQLCEQAAVEHDTTKLLALVNEGSTGCLKKSTTTEPRKHETQVAITGYSFKDPRRFNNCSPSR